MLVLFDLDGTLLDDSAATRAALHDLAQHFGNELASDDLEARWFAAIERHFSRFLSGEISFQEQRRARMRDVFQAQLADAHVDALFDIYLAAYERSWQLFPDVEPCLDALARHKLGVVTNGDSQQQRRKLATLGILDRFGCVAVSGEIGWSKPDPRLFLVACEAGCTEPRDAVYIGDRYETDVLGARRAGLRAVWLDRLSGSLPPHCRTETRLTTLADLPALIE